MRENDYGTGMIRQTYIVKSQIFGKTVNLQHYQSAEQQVLLPWWDMEEKRFSVVSDNFRFFTSRYIFLVMSILRKYIF